ncbi:methionine--tRNA ligase [Defluviitalea saccharophila]|uniref:Methionine--tRNA ligase n=1 Tax=Defluviitalea saccharophila TaxID=879970 RepID=A0ABZ2Y150_9FIRM
MNKKTYYITTPIYYPSDKLHIGHSYTTVAADAMARYKRLRGYDVKFLTGTDEHGQKIERIAQQKGMTPKAYVDSIVTWIKELWKIMNISYDTFIRTTDDYHEKTVQKIFKKLYEKGDIYKSSYEGWYCTPCETFFTERQLKEGKCPDCGREVEKVKEESYFFKLSKYQDRLIEYIESHPEFIQPQTRQNEMINNFLKPGLEDLCVSRTSFKWGIPVEFDPGHVVYVWVDALSNYISALGFMSENDEEYKKYWPADVHLVGKEIVRFHTIIWPALLMALDEPLPKQVFGHGWLVIDGGKMSKSKGNVVDPKVLVDHYGADAIRYFLLREVAFGQDGNFTNEALIQRINSDLANDFGNLLSRTVAMVDKYFNGTLPLGKKATTYDEELKTLAQATVSKVEEYMEKLLFSDALTEIWNLIRRANKYIDETQPWVLAKDEDKKDELANVLYNLGEILRIVSIIIEPFMPTTPRKVWEQLSLEEGENTTWDSAKVWGRLPQDFTVKKGEILFPRIDMKVELEKLEEAQNKAREESVAKAEEKKEEKAEEKQETEFISIEDFAKLDLRIGEVLQCEKVEKADKLLKSQIKIGNEVRQIVSGIAKYYTPEEMVGKKVIVVCNLKPVKLRGILSEGMILAASDENGNLVLASTDKDIESGAKVK